MLRLVLVASALAMLAAGCGGSSDEDGGDAAATPTPRPGPETPMQVCRVTADHITPLILRATVLPAGVKLVRACSTVPPLGIPDPQIADFFYEDSVGERKFQVSTIIIDVKPGDREQIQLGEVTGYKTSTPRDDGTQVYGVEFAKSGRAYTVIAILGGKNTLTPEDLNAAALSIAEQ